MNDKGEWACAHADVPYLIVGERKDFGVAHSGSGGLMHIWIVQSSTLQED
ncbi:MAG: hypothetical protein WAV18_29620 [Roseiarcus sp.]